MFNVGDEVTLLVDYPITKEGDIGTITYTDGFRCIVRLHTMQMKNFIGHEFSFPPTDIKHAEGRSYTAIERKIRKIYARQGRRTKLSCFC